MRTQQRCPCLTGEQGKIILPLLIVFPEIPSLIQPSAHTTVRRDTGLRRITTIFVLWACQMPLETGLLDLAGGLVSLEETRQIRFTSNRLLLPSKIVAIPLATASILNRTCRRRLVIVKTAPIVALTTSLRDIFPLQPRYHLVEATVVIDVMDSLDVSLMRHMAAMTLPTTIVGGVHARVWLVGCWVPR